MTKQKKILLNYLLKEYKQYLKQNASLQGKYATIDLRQLRKIISSPRGDIYVSDGIRNAGSINGYMAKIMILLKRGANKVYVHSVHGNIAGVKANINSPDNGVIHIPTQTLLQL